MVRHFLDLFTVGSEACRLIVDHARSRKDARADLPRGAVDADRPLSNHALALIFEKPSTRTRVSFQMAMHQLGGTCLTLSGAELQLGRGETIEDTARVMSRYVDALMLRTASHATVTDLARASAVPVINGLTDLNHPCQALADVMTFEEHRGTVAGSTWAWLGDGNNMANALIEAAGVFGFHIRLGVPTSHLPNAAVVEQARACGSTITFCPSADDAVAGVDAVATDTWVSMGQIGGAAKLAAMKPYQVTAPLMAKASPEAVFLHCLPAHRGEEVTDAVIDGPQSIVWDEAENRLHAQKAILLWCLNCL
ncbi:ornithine carbamoyltransferase [Hankyongella ginsenosidimutans]|uniref:Ornithine carbamoyltransferase n=1 Tax=Hankyongella ginsenosidimutans TaxID=1763828 RepID=A0A4D7CBG1_9SPHN|nr:ornithine carbamoyltransferase [Hankyongella ginsenosidimutans]QCI79536.1 ornithine carbamoyltransferase [Hankyongella ginsenosidimutans]TXG81235.1 MAG: ornithine carbamoyltransferase [Sphingomonadales bacterium]